MTKHEENVARWARAERGRRLQAEAEARKEAAAAEMAAENKSRALREVDHAERELQRSVETLRSGEYMDSSELVGAIGRLIDAKISLALTPDEEA